MKSIFRYPGSKWSMAEWIISMFPEGYEKMVYLEPFVGSGAVFFNKEPSCVETINDLDGEIINLFKVLRDQPEELARAIELTPYSRAEYDRAFEQTDDPLENARRFLVKTNQALGAKLSSKCGWRNHKQEKVGGTACKWRGIPESIWPIVERLQGTQTQLVQIEQIDAFKLIQRYNSADVLMYLDPPYLRSTRKSGRLYKEEMSEKKHKELLELVKCSRAKIIISGYASELYDEELQGWHRFERESQITSGEKAEEVVWMNYEPPYEQIDIISLNSSGR